MFKLTEAEKKTLVYVVNTKAWSGPELDAVVWEIFKSRMGLTPVSTAEDLPAPACPPHEPEYNLLRPRADNGEVITHRCRKCFVGMIPKTFQIDQQDDNQP